MSPTRSCKRADLTVRPRSAGRVSAICVALGLLAACSTPSEVTVGTAARAATRPASDAPDSSSPDSPGTTSPSPDSAPPSNDTTAATAPSNTTSAPTPEPKPIEFRPCADLPDVECATLEVPYDYGAPELGQLALKVFRRPADEPDQRIGSVIVNPGGPGSGTSFLLTSAAQFFSESTRRRFDIIGVDPRGTGDSEPAIDCIDDDDYDTFFATDPSPDSPDEQQAAVADSQAFVDACVARNEPKLLARLSTPNAARDMDQVRRALGEDTITYIGFSYGSELGATWVTMFPSTVRAAVLDGAVDPNESSIEQSRSQLIGFEKSFRTFLDGCESDSECAFETNGDGAKAFGELSAALDAKPISGRMPVNQGVLFTAVIQAMYSESLWPALAQALGAAQQGKGEGLVALYDDYFGRSPDGSIGNLIEAFTAITCADDHTRGSIETADADRAQVVKDAPLLGAGWGADYVCSLWPIPEEPKIAITGKGAPPVVVIGTTGDPATPLSSTERMAETLESGTLVVVEANRHTGQLVNDCVTKAVDDYLVDLVVPAADLYCAD